MNWSGKPPGAGTISSRLPLTVASVVSSQLSQGSSQLNSDQRTSALSDQIVIFLPKILKPTQMSKPANAYSSPPGCRTQPIPSGGSALSIALISSP